MEDIITACILDENIQLFAALDFYKRDTDLINRKVDEHYSNNIPPLRHGSFSERLISNAERLLISNRRIQDNLTYLDLRIARSVLKEQDNIAGFGISRHHLQDIFGYETNSAMDEDNTDNLDGKLNEMHPEQRILLGGETFEKLSGAESITPELDLADGDSPYSHFDVSVQTPVAGFYPGIDIDDPAVIRPVVTAEISINRMDITMDSTTNHAEISQLDINMGFPEYASEIPIGDTILDYTVNPAETNRLNGTMDYSESPSEMISCDATLEYTVNPAEIIRAEATAMPTGDAAASRPTDVNVHHTLVAAASDPPDGAAVDNVNTDMHRPASAAVILRVGTMKRDPRSRPGRSLPNKVSVSKQCEVRNFMAQQPSSHATLVVDWQVTVRALGLIKKVKVACTAMD